MTPEEIQRLTNHSHALLLLMTMQDADQETPNVAHVRDNPTPPPAEALTDEDKLFLRDLIARIDPGVYRSYRSMLLNNRSVGVSMIDENALGGLAVTHVDATHGISDDLGIGAWDGPAPHPVRDVMRTLVEKMLA